MKKEGRSIDSMKAPQLIYLARKLGCNTGILKSLTTKAFIKRVLNEYNLLKMDTKHTKVKNNPIQNFMNQLYIINKETYFVMIFYRCFSKILFEEVNIPRLEEILPDGM